MARWWSAGTVESNMETGGVRGFRGRIKKREDDPGRVSFILA